MFVLPTSIAPASMSRCTAGAVAVARYEKAGQAAVVCMPATSMLSLTANGTPASGSDESTVRARSSARSSSTSEIQIGRSPFGANPPEDVFHNLLGTALTAPVALSKVRYRPDGARPA